LPEEDQLALPVIFFMLMPVEIEQFGRYCLISQEMLVPRAPLHPNYNKNVFVKINPPFGQPVKEDKYKIECWSTHYNSYNTTSASFVDATFAIISTSKISIPKQIGPTSIDDIQSKAQYSYSVKYKFMCK
jgi:hypothetical protein